MIIERVQVEEGFLDGLDLAFTGGLMRAAMGGDDGEAAAPLGGLGQAGDVTGAAVFVSRLFVVG